MKKSEGTWKGKPLEDYSRDQLIEIVLSLAKEIDAVKNRHLQDLEFITSLHKG